jgi:hypothetical protein
MPGGPCFSLPYALCEAYENFSLFSMQLQSDLTSKLDALYEEGPISLLPLHRINEDLEKQKVSSYRALLDEK